MECSKRVYKLKRIWEEIELLQDSVSQLVTNGSKIEKHLYKWAQENGYIETLTLEEKTPTKL